jgi:hypothetical protein
MALQFLSAVIAALRDLYGLFLGFTVHFVQQIN